jgi:hypothetical protein
MRGTRNTGGDWILRFARSFRYLTSFTELNVDGQGGSLYGEFFVATDIPAEGLEITEGSLLIVKREDVMTVDPRFAPTTRFVMNVLLNKQQS